MEFKDLNVHPLILKAIEEQGYTNPTPIQEQSIPVLLDGKDLLGCAQTGTGKTAAFSIPILNQMYQARPEKGRRKIRTLVITPTRELAIQVYDNIRTYSKHLNFNSAVIFGGVKQGSQVSTLKQGVDILIATPGRLLDLISQGFISLKHIEHFVLDEADQMLDMGFIHDIKKILDKLPKQRQSLFFSATMAPPIVDLSKKILGQNVARVTIEPEKTTSEKVDQCLYFVAKEHKVGLLLHLMKENPVDRVLVFTRTKYGADKVVRKLNKADIKAAAIHGNKTQNARQKALKEFKSKELSILVATDIAARGIDIAELELVINFDLPNVPESYVHRIGRTGRASATGDAISFCDLEERAYLKDIQKLIKTDIKVIEQHPFIDDRVLGEDDEKSQRKKEKAQQNKNRNRNRNRNSNIKKTGSNNQNKNSEGQKKSPGNKPSNNQNKNKRRFKPKNKKR